MKMSVKQKHV